MTASERSRRRPDRPARRGQVRGRPAAGRPARRGVPRHRRRGRRGRGQAGQRHLHRARRGGLPRARAGRGHAAPSARRPRCAHAAGCWRSAAARSSTRASRPCSTACPWSTCPRSSAPSPGGSAWTGPGWWSPATRAAGCAPCWTSATRSTPRLATVTVPTDDLDPDELADQIAAEDHAAMTATRIDVTPSDGGPPYQVVVGVGVLSELPGLVPRRRPHRRGHPRRGPRRDRPPGLRRAARGRA